MELPDPPLPLFVRSVTQGVIDLYLPPGGVGQTWLLRRRPEPHPAPCTFGLHLSSGRGQKPLGTHTDRGSVRRLPGAGGGTADPAFGPWPWRRRNSAARPEGVSDLGASY